MERESQEYLNVVIKANVELDDQPVWVAVVPVPKRPVSGDWKVAVWLGEPANKRYARLGPSWSTDYPPGKYNVYVKVDDNPEIVILYAGQFLIK